MNTETPQMPVAALCNGTVLDHIPSDALFRVVSLLDLEQLNTPITIGNNFPSQRLGSKGVIKLAERFFAPDELNRIALIAPEVHLNEIRNYKVVKKEQLTLPRQVENLVRCTNPKCITNNEPMHTRFVTHAEGHDVVLECAYCGRKQQSNQLEWL